MLVRGESYCFAQPD